MLFFLQKHGTIDPEMTASKYRIFLDLEYCYPGMTRAKGRPSESEQRQVVQIAAIRFDTTTGKEVGAFDALVRPALGLSLPRFFVQLTHINQRMVDAHGLLFPQALQKFQMFCGHNPIWIFNADWNVLRQNCGYFNMKFPYERTPFIRVKHLLPAWGINADAYSSGTLYRAANISMSGHVHNALHDVRSMAAAVHEFEKQERSIQIPARCKYAIPNMGIR